MEDTTLSDSKSSQNIPSFSDSSGPDACHPLFQFCPLFVTPYSLASVLLLVNELCAKKWYYGAFSAVLGILICSSLAFQIASVLPRFVMPDYSGLHPHTQVQMHTMWHISADVKLSRTQESTHLRLKLAVVAAWLTPPLNPNVLLQSFTSLIEVSLQEGITDVL